MNREEYKEKLTKLYQTFKNELEQATTEPTFFDCLVFSLEAYRIKERVSIFFDQNGNVKNELVAFEVFHYLKHIEGYGLYVSTTNGFPRTVEEVVRYDMIGYDTEGAASTGF